MASIRRTLSPIPRQGFSLSGEVCSVGSPLSKSSSSSQNPQVTATSGASSSLLGFLDSHAFGFGVSSPKSSRPLDRSKPKGVQAWKRALVLYFVCFALGTFLGLAPFASMEFSGYSISKDQSFSFEMTSLLTKNLENTTINAEKLVDEEAATKANATLEPQMKIHTIVSQTIHEDLSQLPQKLLIIITPTHAQPYQAFYLNRLAHTLKLVGSPLMWIVVEMSSQSSETAEILRRTGIMYRHLSCNINLTSVVDMDAHYRNVALAHIETHRLDGIVYFADVDNIYSTHLFDQMRHIRRFGTWKVGKLAENGNEFIVEGPVCNGSQVVGWHTKESIRRLRRFHAEMSGFGFNSTILWDPKRWHRPTIDPIRQVDTVKDEFKVSTFIEQVVEDESQMEGLSENCTSVMVWHLQLRSTNSFYPNKWVLTNHLDVIAPIA